MDLRYRDQMTLLLKNPILINQQVVFNSQFSGMTDEPFGYVEFEGVRKNLIKTVNQKLTTLEKEFLFAFAKGNLNGIVLTTERFPV
jgi:hypothetical protein